ncbi:hypothetical protein FFLO_02325 [Filobasidium floriforme]|uniref:Major facilitator superfamily (MFS) profile domain-containing protein n=1 Tax=Filobasidium floriforme TaxID=5210 RepID=A0A8K0JN82_9TREE|nr:general substrate transporter [Filobasidium floriforme]KAG7562239.1 hypothetical protein FFLO_02325 [Filobasidium floriforme]KAH8080542.1 general substrate transporter [Filobasidium floriforme]
MDNAAHDKVLHHNKVAFINYLAAVFAAFGSFLFGYDSGIIGSVISPSYNRFHEYFHAKNSPLVDGKERVDPNITGAIVSVFAGGAFFGALLAGFTANKIGRKRTIQLGSLIATVGCAIQTGAINVGMLIAGRFIAGLAIGVLSMIVPLYQAEISPPHARGLLSGWTQQMIGFGFLVASLVGFGCESLTTSDAQWRIPLAIQIVPAVVLFGGMFFLPYSPRWLASVGREDEARSALVRLHGGERRADMEVIDAEFSEIQAQISWERENVSTSPLDLVRTRPNLHRTLCGCLVQAMCQWTGVNVNAYFAPTIYSNLGYTGNKPLLINSIQSVWSLVVTFVFITFLVDRIGRRKPLIIGPIFMAGFLAWQAGIASQFTAGKGNSGLGIAGIASIFLFSGAFSMSYGPVSWIYQSEIFPMNLRAMGTSASTAANWLNNVIISQFTPIGLENLGWKFFLLFVATNLSNAVLAYFLFPETKGKTLEEIAAVFGDTNVVRPPTEVAINEYEDDKKMGEFSHYDRTDKV